MKNLVVIIISSMMFNLSAMAKPTINGKNAITKKEAIKYKENNPTARKKKKIDITVEKITKTDNKLTKWSSYSSEKEKYTPYVPIEQKSTSKYEKQHKNFQKWANKIPDSIERGLKISNPKH